MFTVSSKCVSVMCLGGMGDLHLGWGLIKLFAMDHGGLLEWGGGAKKRGGGLLNYLPWTTGLIGGGGGGLKRGWGLI